MTLPTRVQRLAGQLAMELNNERGGDAETAGRILQKIMETCEACLERPASDTPTRDPDPE